MFQGPERIAQSLLFGVVIHAFRALVPLAMAAVTDGVEWNYAFLLAVPFIVVASAMIWTLPRHHGAAEHQPGVSSVLLLLIGLTSLQIGPSRGERNLWFESLHIVLVFLAAMLCLGLWAWWG